MYDNIKKIGKDKYEAYFFYNGRKFYVKYEYINNTEPNAFIGNMVLLTIDGRKLPTILLNFFNFYCTLGYHIKIWHTSPVHKVLSL